MRKLSCDEHKPAEMKENGSSPDPSASGSESLLGSLMETLWALVKLDDLMAEERRSM